MFEGVVGGVGPVLSGITGIDQHPTLGVGEELHLLHAVLLLLRILANLLHDQACFVDLKRGYHS